MKIALLFPGYTSQFVGMAKELYDENRIVQEYFEEASNCLNINFVKLCFASSDVELAKMGNAYSAIFLVSGALHALLKQEEIKPAVVAGYNNGEYSALFAAGGMSFPDGLYLLTKFCNFYQEMLEHVAINIVRVRGMSADELEKLCEKMSNEKELVTIALYNTLQDNIIAGHAPAVKRVHDALHMQAQINIDGVGVEVCVHSPIMDSVVGQFKIYLEKVDFNDLNVPLLNCMDGHLIKKGSEIKKHIVQHINTAVKWVRVIASLDAYDLVVEVGPGTKLSAMVKQMYPDKKTIAINKRADIDALHKIMS